MAARKNKSSHLPQGMIVHEKKSDGSLPDYIIQITPAEKAQFYEEFFQFFMTKIRTDDPPRYTMIAEMVRELERLPGMGMVLYVQESCSDILRQGPHQPASPSAGPSPP